MPPTFTPHATVTVDSAKQDLISIRLDGWIVSYSGDGETAIFLRGLNPNSETLLTASGPVIVPRLIFTQSNSSYVGYRGRVPIIAQNSGKRRMASRPLFGGCLKISPRSQREDAAGRAIAFDLDLNPTRFVRHQGYVRNIGDPVSQWAFPHPRLSTGGELRGGEACLDGNDNVLASPRLERMGSPEAWGRQLGRYWHAVTETLDSLLTNAARVAQVGLSRGWRFSVQYVETYWEFSASDALSLVRQLSPHLCSYAEQARTRTYFTEQREGNTLSIRLRLPHGRYMKIYAKTTTRVRFEVEHQLTSSSVHLEHGHTGQTFAAFSRVLSECAEQAAVEVNALLQFLADYMAAETGESAYRLLHRIIAIAGDPEIAEAIVSIIVNRDGVALRPNDPLRPVVSELVNAGILRRTREYGQTYRVCPQYNLAVAQLRGQQPMRFRSVPRNTVIPR